MAVELLTGEGRPVHAVDGADIAFKAVAQEGQMSSPAEVAGDVAEVDAEAGEHHHGHDEDRTGECTVLKKTNFD